MGRGGKGPLRSLKRPPENVPASRGVVLSKAKNLSRRSCLACLLPDKPSVPHQVHEIKSLPACNSIHQSIHRLMSGNFMPPVYRSPGGKRSERWPEQFPQQLPAFTLMRCSAAYRKSAQPTMSNDPVSRSQLSSHRGVRSIARPGEGRIQTPRVVGECHSRRERVSAERVDSDPIDWDAFIDAGRDEDE